MLRGLFFRSSPWSCCKDRRLGAQQGCHKALEDVGFPSLEAG